MWNVFRINFLAIWNPAWQWARNHNRLAALGMFTLVILFTLLTFHSCSSPPTGTSASSSTPATGYFFWKLILIALLLIAYGSYRQAAIHNRTNIRFPFWVLTGAVIVFLVLIGAITFVDWAIFGLLVISFNFWTKSDGRMKSFLGFISGVLILFWMLLLYLEHSAKINIGFLSKLFNNPVSGLPDDTSKILFALFVAIFIFAIWKRSKFFYLISFIVFLSFLGNATIDEIANRYPTKLTPSIPISIAPTASKIGGALEKTADAFASKMSAEAGRSAVSARKHNQEQRVWEVPAGKTLVYECSAGQCTPAYYMQYNKPTEIISLEESLDINGVVYEKFSLPDPITDQPGKYQFFVPAGKFSEKLSEKKVEKKTGNKKVHFYPMTTEVQHKGETLYSARLELAAGEYEISPPSNVFIGSSPDPLIKEGKRFVLDRDQKMIHILAKSKPIKITPQ